MAQTIHGFGTLIREGKRIIPTTMCGARAKHRNRSLFIEEINCKNCITIRNHSDVNTVNKNNT